MGLFDNLNEPEYVPYDVPVYITDSVNEPERVDDVIIVVSKDEPEIEEVEVPHPPCVEEVEVPHPPCVEEVAVHHPPCRKYITLPYIGKLPLERVIGGMNERTGL